MASGDKTTRYKPRNQNWPEQLKDDAALKALHIIESKLYESIIRCEDSLFIKGKQRLSQGKNTEDNESASPTNMQRLTSAEEDEFLKDDDNDDDIDNTSQNGDLNNPLFDSLSREDISDDEFFVDASETNSETQVADKDVPSGEVLNDDVTMETLGVSQVECQTDNDRSSSQVYDSLSLDSVSDVKHKSFSCGLSCWTRNNFTSDHLIVSSSEAVNSKTASSDTEQTNEPIKLDSPPYKMVQLFFSKKPEHDDTTLGSDSLPLDSNETVSKMENVLLNDDCTSVIENEASSSPSCDRKNIESEEARSSCGTSHGGNNLPLDSNKTNSKMADVLSDYDPKLNGAPGIENEVSSSLTYDKQNIEPEEPHSSDGTSPGSDSSSLDSDETKSKMADVVLLNDSCAPVIENEASSSPSCDENNIESEETQSLCGTSLCGDNSSLDSNETNSKMPDVLLDYDPKLNGVPATENEASTSPTSDEKNIESEEPQSSDGASPGCDSLSLDSDETKSKMADVLLNDEAPSTANYEPEEPRPSYETSDDDDDILFKVPNAIIIENLPKSTPAPVTVPDQSDAFSFDYLVENLKLSINQNLDAELSSSEISTTQETLGAKPKKRDAGMEMEVSSSYVNISEQISTAHRSLNYSFVDHISDAPPGVKIFHQDKVKLAFRHCDLLNSNECEWLKGESSAKALKLALESDSGHFIESVYTYCQTIINEKTKNCVSFIKLLFLLMSESDDIQIVDSCFEALVLIMNYADANHSFVNVFSVSLEVFLLVLQNMGADLDQLFMSNSLLISNQKAIIINKMKAILPHLMSDIPKEADDVPYTYNPFFPQYNLNQVLQFIAIYQKSKFAIKDSVEICKYVVILLQLCLDKLFHEFDPNLELNVQDLISVFIDGFSDTDFPKQAQMISEALLACEYHHHNSAHLMQVFPLTSRGLQLQKSASFLMLQHYMGVDNVKYVHDVNPKVVLSLLQENSFKMNNNYYKLNSIILLIDFAVGREYNKKYRDVLLMLASLIEKSMLKVKETMECLDGSFLKDSVTKVTSKWKIITQTMSYTQVTLFDCVPSQRS